MPKIDFKGRQVEALDVEFKVTREDWNEYQLSDGTEVRVRLIVQQVLVIPNEFDQEGNPIYMVKSGNVMVVRAPDHLKKPQGA